MADDLILLDVADRVATITLNRPEARNAMPKRGWELLHEYFERLNANPDIRVIIITGTGSAFCSGDDIKEVAEMMQREALWEIRQITLAIQRLTRDIVHSPKPVIAAANGWALGAGFELVMACDFAYAAES